MIGCVSLLLCLLTLVYLTHTHPPTLRWFLPESHLCVCVCVCVHVSVYMCKTVICVCVVCVVCVPMYVSGCVYTLVSMWVCICVHVVCMCVCTYTRVYISSSQSQTTNVANVLLQETVSFYSVQLQIPCYLPQRLQECPPWWTSLHAIPHHWRC